MRQDQQETAEVFLRRKAKNLEFFRKSYPVLYKHYSTLLLRRVELVVSPQESDVDLHVEGKSLYRGRAKMASLSEVESFLSDNEPYQRLRTLSPPTISGYNYPRFASRALRRCLEKMPDLSSGFEGYPMENFFPFVVFLGCGLGYHIEALCERADIINALVFEPDEEKFAASLFTVDWEGICKRFLDRKGYDIRFAIGIDASEKGLKSMLERNLNRKVPFHPAFTIYFNHQACGINRSFADQVRQDLPTLFAGWGNYDDEARRLNNTSHNAAKAHRRLRPRADGKYVKPLVVVGSGPSLDERVGSIKRFRNDLIVVSAGTGLKALIQEGLKPDYHVELDPDYFIFQLLSDIGRENLHGITLIAVNEVNALVPSLFDEVYFYAKRDNPSPGFFGFQGSVFDHCNPTCTNAAVAIFAQLGFKNIFLFGTDYGFRERAKHHSSKSVYGRIDSGSDVSRRLNQLAQKTFGEGKLLTVPAVDGGSIYTRPDYYTAKRSVEELLSWAKKGSEDLDVYNCSDGACIDGAAWISEETFEEIIAGLSTEGLEERSPFIIQAHSVEWALDSQLAEKLVRLSRSLQARVREIRETALNVRLRGKKDLNRLVTQLAEKSLNVGAMNVSTAPAPEDVLSLHLLRGTLMHFMTVGLCYGMSCPSAEACQETSKVWRDELIEFLDSVGNHFDSIFLSEYSQEGLAWLHKTIHDSEPELL